MPSLAALLLYTALRKIRHILPRRTRRALRSYPYYELYARQRQSSLPPATLLQVLGVKSIPRIRAAGRRPYMYGNSDHGERSPKYSQPAPPSPSSKAIS